MSMAYVRLRPGPIRGQAMWSVRRQRPLCFSVNGSVVYDNATEANPGDVGLISEASDEEV